MAGSIPLNACRFTATSSGTGDFTYSAFVAGFNSIAASGAVNGKQVSYRAESSDLSQWEIGTGTVNTGTGVVSRTTVLYNSSGTGSATGQTGAGTKISFIAAPQVSIVTLDRDVAILAAPNVYTDTTASTSSTTGSATFAGGVGIAGDLFVGGNIDGGTF